MKSGGLSGNAGAVSGVGISKVAVGCASIEALRARQAARARDGEVPVRTRFRPKRADELVGGSLYWIIRHRIAARQKIVGFDEDVETRQTVIRLDPQLIRVQPQPKRAHQGWRYLHAVDAPPDLDAQSGDARSLPPALLAQLAALALI